MQIPRIMITGSSSGSGKTAITCAILSALKQKNIDVAACKCGPDYIDPMFHREVLQVPSENLDLFFSTKDSLQELFVNHGKNRDIVITEGVMGYYDGIAGISTRASAFEVAKWTKTPAVLIVDGKGMSVSVTALIQGFLTYQTDNQIEGVIFNRVSPMLYPRLRKMVEEQLGIQVYGYVPELKGFKLESRHLGLKLPEEIKELKEQMHLLGKQIWMDC